MQKSRLLHVESMTDSVWYIFTKYLFPDGLRNLRKGG